MSGSTIAHRSFPLSFVRLLVNYETVIGDDRADLILFLFTANAKDLVVDLDAHEVLGEDFGVAEGDGCCGLRGQIMDHQLVIGVIIIVQTRLILR